MARLIVGIDFGTSTTVVRYKMEGTDDVLPVKDGNGIDVYSPSVIFRSSEGQPTEYGHQALGALNNGREGELIKNFKMGLISADVSVRQQKKQEIEEFLRYIYDCFCKEVRGLNYDGMDVYVSYPAKWDSDMASFMKSTVSKVGFRGTVEGITEPEAATRQMLYQNIEKLMEYGLDITKPLNVFMLDMGAGTSDVAIFRLSFNQEGKEFHEMSIDNMRFYPTVDDEFLCGGREVDKKLMDFVNDFCEKEIGFKEVFSIVEAKKWKDENVSRMLERGEVLGLPNEAIKPIKMFLGKGTERCNDVINKFSLTQGTFEYLTHDVWDSLNEIITSAITKYRDEFGVGAEDIDLLLLTGGHSQWYTVLNLFNGKGVNGNIGVNDLHFNKLIEQPWRVLSAGNCYLDCVAAGCMRHNSIKIESTSANNVWLQVKVADHESQLYEIVKVGDILPTKEVEIRPRFSLNRSALERQVFDVVIEVYSGKTKEEARKSEMRTVIDNDSGRWFANLVLLGLPIFFGGYDTTIEIPMKLKVNRDNTLSMVGYLLYGSGANEPSDKLEKVKYNGKVVEITTEKLQYV